MICRDIMTTALVTLREGDSVGDAVDKLLEHRFVILPVTDAAQRYKGVFGVFELLQLLLPRSATLDHLVTDLGFMDESLADFREALANARGRPVAAVMRTDLPVLSPDSSVMESQLLLYRSRSTLPVVDKASGRLVGVVSYWDAVTAIAGSRA